MLITVWFIIKDDSSPDILQWAPVNVISVSDCQDDWGSQMSEAQICIRDDNGEFGACFVSKGLFTRYHYNCDFFNRN